MSLTQLSINTQALAILQLVEDRLPENTHVSAYALYNGRERGVVLKATLDYRQYTYIHFAETRNSDSVFVTTWESADTFNPPTIEDIPGAAYAQRQSFSYGNYAEVVEHIVGLLPDSQE